MSSWPCGPTRWPTGSAPSAGSSPCGWATTSPRSWPCSACSAAATSPWWCRPPTRRWRPGSSRATSPTASSRGTATRSSSRRAAEGAPSSSTRTWPSCSARRGRPDPRSWCGSRTTTCRATPRRSPRTSGWSATDRAALTLPLHYCYGLSVLHSHLAVGASVLVGAGSVVDPCFWDRVRRHGVTNFAGVPHTFDLLDRVGFADLELPSLRFVTQAGGRMAPEAVRRHADAARRRGRDLVVMYGQTEATARMAYLPPELATVVPSAVGRAIPGGSLRVDRPGRARRRGARLLGAERDARLRDGARPTWRGAGRSHELRTGDLGRVDERGLVHVVGRTGRFAKLFGLRLDLDEIERSLGPGGRRSSACPTTRSSPSASWPRPTPRPTPSPRRCGSGWACPGRRSSPSPTTTSRVSRPGSRIASGSSPMPEPGTARPPPTRPTADPWCDRCTGRCWGAAPSVPRTRSSTSAATRSPTSRWRWCSRSTSGSCPRRGTSSASGSSRRWFPRSRRVPSVETNVGLRAAAIALVVGTHAGVFAILGGAHLLLAVAGYNFARFQVGATGPGRVRRGLTSIARIAVPVVLWISMMFTWREPFSLPRLLLVDNVAGEGLWRYWFVEILLQLLAAAGRGDGRAARPRARATTAVRVRAGPARGRPARPPRRVTVR